MTTGGVGGSTAGTGGMVTGGGGTGGMSPGGASSGGKNAGGVIGQGGASTGGTGAGGVMGQGGTGSSGGAGSGGASSSGGTSSSGGAASDCEPSKALSPGDHEYTLQSANGLTYKYTIVVPTTVVPGKKAPLTFFWHALQSNPEESRGLTNLDAKTSSLGMITVHPRSPDASWNVGSCCTATVLGRPRDEVVFVKELIAAVQAKVCIDTRRVYTSGFSNGGMMSHMLACKMSDVFAAAAPIGSTLTVPADQCQPTRPISILAISGTADPLVGYSAPGLSGGVSVPDSFKIWSQRDRCVGQPKTTFQKGKATCQNYDACDGAAEVGLCTVEGMGHCIPGMKKESATNCFTKLVPLGMPNDDLQGIDVAMDFLVKHALP